jgi:hypothetical protein
VYSNQSGGIVDVLEGLRDQANEQLDKERKEETASRHGYEQLKQSLSDSIKFANLELSDSKKGLATSQETQASAQGDLEVTKKDLGEDQSSLGDLHGECMARAQDFETQTKSRKEEMRGLAIAKKAMRGIQLRGKNRFTSFMQSSVTVALREGPARRAVSVLRSKAQKTNDEMLTQLASRMSSTVTMMSSAGQDPFAKIKEMIMNSISKLQDEQAADATQKAYCDKNLAETEEKVASNKAKVEKHTVKIEQKSSTSIKVKGEVATLQEELATLNKEKLDMDNLRNKEKSDYEHNKAETELSLKEIKFALKTMRDFYADYEKQHEGFSASDGHAGGLIAMLEEVESEFAVNTVQLTTEEQQAEAEYKAAVKTYETTKVIKEQGIKYKTKEHVGLDKYARDETADRDGVQSELDANNDALSQLRAMCTGEIMTYEKRQARREEEMANLKETLEALEEQIAAEGEGG